MNRVYDRIKRDVTKDEKAIAELTDAMIETWFRRHLLTRLFRTLAIMLITFFAATAFVQHSNREQCEGSKVFLRGYDSFVVGAIDVRKSDMKNKSATSKERRAIADAIKTFEEQRALIKPGIEANCAKQYPVIPGIM